MNEWKTLNKRNSKQISSFCKVTIEGEKIKKLTDQQLLFNELLLNENYYIRTYHSFEDGIYLWTHDCNSSYVIFNNGKEEVLSCTEFLRSHQLDKTTLEVLEKQTLEFQEIKLKKQNYLKRKIYLLERALAKLDRHIATHQQEISSMQLKKRETEEQIKNLKFEKNSLNSVQEASS